MYSPFSSATGWSRASPCCIKLFLSANPIAYLQLYGEELRSLRSFACLAVLICFAILILGSSALAEDRDTALRLYKDGNLSLKLGHFDKALRNFVASFTIYERLGHKLGMAVNLNNVGYIYRMRGDYTAALGHYNKSLTIMREMGGEFPIASVLNNIGKIHEAKGDFDQAFSHYEQALKISRKIGMKDLEAKVVKNIRFVYHTESVKPVELESTGISIA